jgi:hypothetical protein
MIAMRIAVPTMKPAMVNAIRRSLAPTSSGVLSAMIRFSFLLWELPRGGSARTERKLLVEHRGDPEGSLRGFDRVGQAFAPATRLRLQEQSPAPVERELRGDRKALCSGIFKGGDRGRESE